MENTLGIQRHLDALYPQWHLAIVTLAVAVSLFIAIIVSRLLIRWLSETRPPKQATKLPYMVPTNPRATNLPRAVPTDPQPRRQVRREHTTAQWRSEAGRHLREKLQATHCRETDAMWRARMVREIESMRAAEAARMAYETERFRIAEAARQAQATREAALQREQDHRRYLRWREYNDMVFKTKRGVPTYPPGWPRDSADGLCTSNNVVMARCRYLKQLFESTGNYAMTLKEERNRWHPNHPAINALNPVDCGQGAVVEMVTEMSKVIGHLCELEGRTTA